MYIRCSGGLLVPYSGGIIEFSVLSAIRPQAANFNHSSVLQAFMLADSVVLAMSGHQHVRASDMRHFYFAIHDITVTARYTYASTPAAPHYVHTTRCTAYRWPLSHAPSPITHLTRDMCENHFSLPMTLTFDLSTSNLNFQLHVSRSCLG